jgi:hypothetical protein
MGPRWPGSTCSSFAFLMRSKLRVVAEVAGRAAMNLSRSWSCVSKVYARGRKGSYDLHSADF